LIVVIVVLGILAMLAVPTFNTIKEKSADSVANKNASAVQRDYNAQAALAQSDPSIVPTGTGAWVINGTSYSYTATTGNTGQNVIASKSNGGGNGGGSAIATYMAGTDFSTNLVIMAGGSFSELGHTNSIVASETKPALYNALLVSPDMSTSTMMHGVLTNGTNTVTFEVIIIDTVESKMFWWTNGTNLSEWLQKFPAYNYHPTSISVDTATSTVTFTVA
jgi:type II secretory pathway pseudopilin PulG